MKFARPIAHVTVVNARLAERRAVKRAAISPVRNPDNIVRQSLMRARLATPAIRRTSIVRRDIPMVMIVAGKTKVQLNKYVVAVKRIQPHAILAVRPKPAPMADMFPLAHQVRPVLKLPIAVTPATRIARKMQLAKMADITPAHNPGNTARPYLTPAIPVTTAIHRTSTVRRDIPMVMIVAGKTKVQLNKYVVAVKRIQPHAILAAHPRPQRTKACPRQYRLAGRIVRNQPRPVVTSTMLPPVDHPRPLQTKACPRQYRLAGRIVRNQPQPVVTSTMLPPVDHP